jgi:serine/threonine-protein kinase
LISNLEGAEVSIDGTPRGATPLKIALAAGTHQIEVHQGTRTRSMPLSVEAGSVVSQYVELAPAEAAPITGRLEITTETPGAQVAVDGEPRGVTPLLLTDIAAGRHKVQVGNGDSRVSRNVDVPGGAVASVMVALAAPAGVSGGWVSVQAPFELQVFEDGQLLGTTTADRLMLAAGRHTLDFVNTSLEFRARQAVDVPAGKTSRVALAIPNGSLSVNALPWADVTLDGRPVGTTPLGNMSVPVGTHEVVWRHPQLGERRRTISVTASSAVRVGMDFSK